VAVKIRLMRVGKKKQPSYRVVVADERSPRDGRFIEIIGQYAPRSEPSVVSVDTDKAVAWLQKGAQPTEQAAKVLSIAGVWDAYRSTTGKDAAAKPAAKTPKPKTVKEAPAPAAAPAAPAAAAEPAAAEPAAAEPAAEVAEAESKEPPAAATDEGAAVTDETAEPPAAATEDAES
jgi:small subunit ribosomal protein S16